MSDPAFPVGPVEDATAEIQEIASKHEIKAAAIHKLHLLHKENEVHHFEEAEKDQHIAAWTVIKFATETVPHGTNYFVKVSIGKDHYLHVRVHRQVHHDVYDFHSLHQTIKHNVETSIWSAEEPLVYFEA